MLTELEKSIRDEIIEKLDWDDYNINDISELAFMLWETENSDGTCTYSTKAARAWIKTYFDDLGEVVEEYQKQTRDLLNPFRDPETFQVIVSIEVTMDLLYRTYKDKMTKDELIEALKALR